jgi:hypothetical protein
LLDAAIHLSPQGYKARAELNFRIEPPPADPYSVSGEGDVRVTLPNGKRVLAFYDQEYAAISDGRATDEVAAGRPYWRAFLPEFSPEDKWEISSGNRSWRLNARTLLQGGPAAPQSVLNSSRNPCPRWPTPLEIALPEAAASAMWLLNSAGQWESVLAQARDLPFSIPEPNRAASTPRSNFCLPDTSSKSAAPSAPATGDEADGPGTTDDFFELHLPSSGFNRAIAAAGKKMGGNSRLWRPVPFWNSNWGGFAGIARANCELAHEMDSLLAQSALAGNARPLVILDGGVLERVGIFNWDHHPLRPALEGPGEVFRSPCGLDFCLRSMRYCIARWSLSSAVSGLCLAATLNAPGASNFHTQLAAALRDWLAGGTLPVAAFHPLAREPQTVVQLANFDSAQNDPLSAWHADWRVSAASETVLTSGLTGDNNCLEVRAHSASSTVIGLTCAYMLGTPENFTLADTLLFDVWIPPQAPADMRAGVHLCDRFGRWYEALLPSLLRPGDWNTFSLDLSAANAQRLQPVKHGVPWNEACRERLTEIGLQVYSVHPNWRGGGSKPLPLAARFANIRALRTANFAPSAAVAAASNPPAPFIVRAANSFTNRSPSRYVWHVDERLGPADGGFADNSFELTAREQATAVGFSGSIQSPYAAWQGQAGDDFTTARALAVDVWVPPEAPPDLRVGLHLRDRDGLWFEALLPGVCRPGATVAFAADLTEENFNRLMGVNHKKPWTAYSRQRLTEIGFHLYSVHSSWRASGGQPLPLQARFSNLRSLERAPQAAPPAVITRYFPPGEEQAASESVCTGGLWQCHLKINRAFANPFDPCQCDLTACISTPSGQEVILPAFFDQLCERTSGPEGAEKVEPVGEEFFTVRYRVLEPGVHHVRFELREGGAYRGDKEGRLEFVPGPVTAKLDQEQSAFVAAARQSFHGFVRAAADQRHFQYDDGTFFYPLGPCARSPSDGRIPYADAKWNASEIKRIDKRGTYQYDDYFASFAQAGINWARVWMCSWWCGLEWRRDWPGYQGFSRYNLLNAWRLDHLLDEAERLGLKLEICLNNHGQYSVLDMHANPPTYGVDTEWENNPYNALLGGPLHSAREFFTDPAARIAQKNRLRYIVARYSHSPAIMAWAMFSELEFVQEFEASNGYLANINNWHSEMAHFLKSLDPNRHLIASHYSHPLRGYATLALPEIDIATSNAYSAFQEFICNNNVCDAPSALADFWTGNRNGVLGFHCFSKPVLVEEQGRYWFGTKENDPLSNTKEQLDADLHAGLWGSLMQPLGGATGYWWWLHLHFDNRYAEYTALSRFLQGEDLRPGEGESPLEPVYRALPTPSNGILRGRGLKSDHRMYAWIYNRFMPQGIPMAPVSGSLLRVTALLPGKYNVEFWNTYTGTLMESRSLEAKAGVPLEISIPEVKGDLALKIKPKP